MFDEDKSVYEWIGQSPHAWLSSAVQLKRAADLVAVELRNILTVDLNTRPSYHDLTLFYSYMLLAGLSLETLTKGIFVGRHPEVVGPDGFDLKQVVSGKGGHDLYHLLRQVDTPSQDELNLIERLSEAVVWAGKYPIHRKSKKSIYPPYGTADFDTVNSLFQRLVAVLHTENPKSTIGFV